MRKRKVSRALLLEFLEDRSLLASDWQNPINRLDVDESGLVTPLDALVVINALLRDGSHKLATLAPGFAPPPFVDVNGNDFIEPLDALTVINYLNISPEEGFSFQKFHVDVTTGEVDVGPAPSMSANGSEGESHFIGSTIVFNSSPLLDEPGDAGRKVLNVSLTNHSGEPLGMLSNGTISGLRVLFSPFTNVSAPSDLRPRTTVSTVAGTGAASSIDGPVGTATINNPTGVVVDGNGDLYVTEFTSNKVRKISNGFVSTLAGSGVASSVDGIGTNATFNNPWGIARNPIDGSLIVTDHAGQSVRRVEADGTVTTIAGTGVAGDTNGAGTVAMFRNPAGVAVDQQGNIYVVESNGHRLRKIVKTAGANPRLASSYTVSVLAGSTASPPTAGFADGAGAAARFSFPRGVAVDSTGVVYVADGVNNRIRRVSADGQVITIAGTGAAGDVDGSGNVATFNSPQGIAVVDDSTLLISNTSSQTVRQITLRPGRTPAAATSWQVATVAGTGVAGFANGAGDVASFNFPRGIAVDSSRTAFVADFSGRMIRRLVPTNGFFPLGAVTGAAPSDAVQLSNATGMIPIANPVLWSPSTAPVRTGKQPYIKYEGALQNGESSPEQAWSFIVPSGVTSFEFTVAVEANTSFLAPPIGVSNSGPSGVGSPDNHVRTVVGTALGGFVDGAATESRFSGMNGIAVDKFGNQYVADTNNHSIRRITPDGFVTTVAGVVGKGAGAEDGLGTSARFNVPNSVAVTEDGNTLFVADSSNHTIRRIQLLGAADPKLPASWYVSTIAGLATTSGYTDNTTGALARFMYPTGITVSPGGIVYVTEYTGNRVRRLQQAGADPGLASNWNVSLVAGSTVGTSGNTDGNGSSARFNGPRQISVDLAGNLYIADAQNYRVRKITPEGDVYTLAGSAYGYADGVGAAAQFGTIYCITVDSAGYVYVGDDTHRIRRVSPSGVTTTIAGTGAYGDTEGTGDEATFYYPTGITVDAAGSLYVVTGGQYQFDGGGSSTSPGLRIRLIERIFAAGNP